MLKSKKNDTIQFKKMSTFITSEEKKVDLIHIFINDVDLLETVKQYEKSWLLQNDPAKTEIAGLYAIPSEEWLCDSIKDQTGNCLIYACGDCLDEGCWSMSVNIVSSNDTVTWSGFRSSIPGCNYDGIGSYKFDFNQYTQAINQMC